MSKKPNKIICDPDEFNPIASFGRAVMATETIYEKYFVPIIHEELKRIAINAMLLTNEFEEEIIFCHEFLELYSAFSTAALNGQAVSVPGFPSRQRDYLEKIIKEMNKQ